MNTVVSTWSAGEAALTPAAAQGRRASLPRRIAVATWRVLESIGRSRANRELLDLADRYESLQPNLARELRAACRQGPMS
jgi:hypothetical protein